MRKELSLAIFCTVFTLPVFSQIGIDHKVDLYKIGKRNIRYHQIYQIKSSTIGNYSFSNGGHLYYKRFRGDHPGLYAHYFLPGDFSERIVTTKEIEKALHLLLSSPDYLKAISTIDKYIFLNENNIIEIQNSNYSEFRVSITNNCFGLVLTVFFVYPA